MVRHSSFCVKLILSRALILDNLQRVVNRLLAYFIISVIIAAKISIEQEEDPLHASDPDCRTGISLQ